MDPFELWVANRDKLEGYFIHSELPAGIALDLPIQDLDMVRTFVRACVRE